MVVKSNVQAKMRNKMLNDISAIRTTLVILQRIGTPQAQRTDEYKHLRLAIESLGALKATLENSYAQLGQLTDDEFIQGVDNAWTKEDMMNSYWKSSIESE